MSQKKWNRSGAVRSGTAPAAGPAGAGAAPPPLPRLEPGRPAEPELSAKEAAWQLGADFVTELRRDFQGSGRAAIETVREERPLDYLKLVSAFAPDSQEGPPDETGIAQIRRIIVRPGDEIA